MNSETYIFYMDIILCNPIYFRRVLNCNKKCPIFHSAAAQIFKKCRKILNQTSLTTGSSSSSSAILLINILDTANPESIGLNIDLGPVLGLRKFTRYLFIYRIIGCAFELKTNEN